MGLSYRAKYLNHSVFSSCFLLILGASTVSCGGQNLTDSPNSKLADVSIRELNTDGYDRYVFKLEGLSDRASFQMSPQEFKKGEGQARVQVPAGEYLVHLDFFNGNDKVFSTSFCSNTGLDNKYQLKPGENQVQVTVCNGNKNVVDVKNVDLEPRSDGTFYVQDGKLYDLTGTEFVMRGINTPNAYYRERSYQALDDIKDFGFNTVRIVWCADNLVRGGRCDTKDFHPLSELKRVLDKMRELHLVAVLNLQNATGSTDPQHLERLVDWYLQDDVKKLLLDYKDMLLINIANEWYGEWNDYQETYRKTYETEIGRLRDGGIPHVLIIDARGWGQQFSSIPENYRSLQKVSGNLIFSAHMYEVFGNPNMVKSSFETIRNQKIPFIVGEFGCSHGSGKPVACRTIMEEASRSDYQFGYLAWSYSGNGGGVEDLDVTNPNDWTSLTGWGQTLINDPNGVRATSKEACFFKSTTVCQ